MDRGYSEAIRQSFEKSVDALNIISFRAEKRSKHARIFAAR